MREVVSMTVGEPAAPAGSRAVQQLASPPDWADHLLSFCDHASRLRLLRLTKAWAAASFGDDDSRLWAVVEQLLCRDALIYRSKHSTVRRSRKAAFLYAHSLRHLWGLMGEEGPAAGGEVETFNIRVCARFRPEDKTRAARELRGKKGVVVPLHQRLQGIKRMSGVRTTSEAAKILMKRIGEGDRSHAASATQVLEINPTTQTVLTLAPGVGMRAFNFDAVFRGEEASQRDVYRASAADVVRDFLNGIDGCCLVYGQTGSGKTFTMFGDGVDGPSAGIVPQSCFEVIAEVERRRRHGEAEGQLALSYIEIFGDEVRDLLNEGQMVAQNQSAAQRWVLEGRAMHPVGSLDDIAMLIAEGEKQKRRASTMMNERSSRAHTLFILSLKQQHLRTGHDAESILILADLGGSEDTNKSGAAAAVTAPGAREVPMADGDSPSDGDDGNDDGGNAAAKTEKKAQWAKYYKNRERMQEAININLGLLALKNCVQALHMRQRGERVHVPFQHSKLTHLLSTVLGGKASTCVIVTGSPAPNDAAESINTLRFGEDCRAVVASGSKIDATARALRKVLEELDKEIAAAEEAYKRSEQWVKEKVRKKREAAAVADSDSDVEGGGYEKDGMWYGADGVAHAINDGEEEMVDVYRMRGGEAEAARLEELLAKRRLLCGQ